MATGIFHSITWIALRAAFGACTAPNGGLFKSKQQPSAVVQTPTDTDIRPKRRPDAPTGTVAVALTVDTASNVTPAEIAEAFKPAQSQTQDKGTTIASLGLLPNGAASGSGSQLSIAAMQGLGVAITDLVEVRVFAQ